MKRFLLITISFLFVSSSLFAQEQSAEPKQKNVFLPEKGDWALGFNAAPILSYIGNLFNGNSNNTFNAQEFGGVIASDGVFTSSSEWLKPIISLNAKYMLSDNLGIRANVGFNFKTTNNTSYVKDDEAVIVDPASQAKVIDKTKINSSGACIGIGVEYRVGKRRIQGVFGGSYIVGGGDIVTKYNYGNTMTEANQVPTTFSGASSSRPLLSRVGNFYTGLSASVGFEWFVAPKIGLGAEMSIAAIYCYKQQKNNQTELFDTYLNKVVVRTNITTPPSHQFILGTDAIDAKLNLNFYF